MRVTALRVHEVEQNALSVQRPSNSGQTWSHIAHRNPRRRPPREISFPPTLSYVYSLLYLFHVPPISSSFCLPFSPYCSFTITRLRPKDTHCICCGHFFFVLSIFLFYFIYFLFLKNASSVFYSFYYGDKTSSTSSSIVWLLCTCADACRLQVKPLQMSPRHRNVKIIQGTLCRQCRRPIWTSSHLAASGPLLAGSAYQSFRIYWCATMRPLPLCLQFISLGSFAPSFWSFWLL